MKNKSKKEKYLNSWNQLMNPEMIRKILDGLGLSDHKLADVEPVSVYSIDKAGCMVNTTCGDRPVKIYVSFLIGAPRWSHFMELVYDHGKNADIQILACSEDYVCSHNCDPDGNLDRIGQLAEYYNDRGCKIIIIQVENLASILGGGTDAPDIKVFQGLIDNNEGLANGLDKIPTKRQLQESEFWVEYYLTSSGADVYDISKSLSNRRPVYFIKNNCEVRESWDDHGLTMRIAGPKGCDFLKWLWNQGQTLITDEFQNCKAFLLGSENMPGGVDFQLIDLSMTKLRALNSSQKRYYAECVYNLESMFNEIIIEIEDEYEEFKKNNLN